MPFKVKKRPNPLQVALTSFLAGAGQGVAKGAQYGLMKALEDQKTDKELQAERETTIGEIIKFRKLYGDPAARLKYAGNPYLEPALGVEIDGAKMQESVKKLYTQAQKSFESAKASGFLPEGITTREDYLRQMRREGFVFPEEYNIQLEREEYNTQLERLAKPGELPRETDQYGDLQQKYGTKAIEDVVTKLGWTMEDLRTGNVDLDELEYALKQATAEPELTLKEKRLQTLDKHIETESLKLWYNPEQFLDLDENKDMKKYRQRLVDEIAIEKGEPLPGPYPYRKPIGPEPPPAGGRLTVAERFDQLITGGKSEEEAYRVLEEEGY